MNRHREPITRESPIDGTLPLLTGSRASDIPILVSFYTGDPYYENHATRLRRECEALGIDHDIRRFDAGNEGWVSLTSAKPGFVLDMLREHKRPVLWVDVDTYLFGRSLFDRPFHADFGGWLRSFKYLRDWDAGLARTWMVASYCVNFTDRALRFWNHVASLHAHHLPGTVTDDYLLESGWRSHDTDLDIEVFRPSLWAVRRQDWVRGVEFLAGHSGNVSHQARRVRQHLSRREDYASRASISAEWSEAVMKHKPQAATLAFGLTQLGGATDQDSLRVARHLAVSGEVDAGLEVLQQHFRARELPTSALPLEFAALYGEMLLDAGRFGELLSLALEWKSSYLPRLRAMGAFFVDAALVEIEEDNSNSTTPRVSAYWMDRPLPGNFGDLLTPFIVKCVTGRWPKRSMESGLMGVGSTLKLVHPSQVVWGTGLSRRSETLGDQPRIASLRGPITWDAVIRNGWQAPRVFGDGALLLPKLLPPREQSPKYRFGFVPHISQSDEVTVEDSIRLITLAGIGESFIRTTVDAILDCEVVASTSLHGIIVAVAYGREAIWCKFSKPQRDLSGDDMKFADFYSSLGVDTPSPLMIQPGQIVDSRFLEGGTRISTPNLLAPGVEESLAQALEAVREETT